MARPENFLDLFTSRKPILAMLHLKGDSPQKTVEIMKREVQDLYQGGVDAVIVENYFGDYVDMERALDALQTCNPGLVVGLNALDNDPLGFALARKYGAAFLQLDSVAGHLPPGEDEKFASLLAAQREASDAFVLGGVRFKYQPVKSGRTLEEDLRLGMQRADAVAVTGDGTGLETPTDKIGAFRAIVGPDYPLVVGAGLTPENCAEQLADAQAAIVGSYFKHNHKDSGDVCLDHVKELVAAVRALNA